ncbi:MAG TPA: DEAD/DEAH box helicase, partial [Longimicrobiales bacterium]
MIVLHAFWRPGAGLHIWGETSEATPSAPLHAGARPATRGAAPAGASAGTRPHPCACPPELLLAALGDAAGAGTVDCALLLPSAADTPAPSPELLAAADVAAVRPERIDGWSAPACALPAGAALDLLLALADLGAEEVVPGASLRYLAEVAKLALELTARGRVLPALERRSDGFFAVWRPVLTDPHDAARLDLLGQAMPGACRAASPGKADAALAAAPRLVLEDALATFADACVREALAARAFPPRSLHATGATQAWLQALASDDSRVQGRAAELTELETRLHAWSAPAAPQAASAFRTCFRLSPPSGTDAWRLDFLLQAGDDPSLLLPAEQVWRARGRTLTLLRRRLEEPQERLLGDLGRALNLFPALEPALRSPRPTALELDVAQAHGFLREAAPLLEQAGFGVLVPPWWKERGARLGLKLHARPKSQGALTSGLLGLEQLCEYEWQLALGDETLSLDEFQALARLKVPLVQLRGQWVELRPEDVQAALRLFEEDGRPHDVSPLELLRLATGAEAAPGGLTVASVEGEGWLAGLLAQDRRLEALPTPADFRGVLRPYQERGLAWLAFLDTIGLGGCLADDMGLGKTIQLLALLVHERAAGGVAPPASPAAAASLPGDVACRTLLVCPMSVVGNWQREAARFAPGLRVHVQHGSERLGGKEFAAAVRQADLVITTYALVARDRETLAAVDWRRVVLDEAQAIKNAATRQTQAVRALRAPHRLALTGTPVENRLSELWSILDFLNPGLLGSAREFRDRFATPIERYRDEERAGRLRRLTGPFVLRRLKTDRTIIDDLPPKLEIKAFCNLTREQASLYQAIVDDMLKKIASSDGIQRKGLVLATMVKLKQVCNHPAQLLQDRSELPGRSGKLALLEDTLEEALAAGDRALVFTQFAEMGEMLRAHLRRRLAREVLFLHGGTPRKARDDMVARFQSADGPSVFVLSLKAGGTGLNLTAANQVIHFDRWWNPAVE